MSKLDELAKPFKEKIIELKARLFAMGIKVIETSCYRSIDEQDKLYAQGRTTSGKIVTKAKGGQSPHNFRLACDLCPLRPTTHDLWWDAPDDVWNCMHRVGEELGLRAGYDFQSIKDGPHFEDPDWKVTQAAWRQGNWTA